ncbi:MAG: hypothetical protein ACMG6E_03845 [Candidatus Roizmanbacteria bacterium]
MRHWKSIIGISLLLLTSILLSLTTSSLLPHKTLGWQRYDDQKYNYTIKYPVDWKVIETPQSGLSTVATFIPSRDSDTTKLELGQECCGYVDKFGTNQDVTKLYPNESFRDYVMRVYRGDLSLEEATLEVKKGTFTKLGDYMVFKRVFNTENTVNSAHYILLINKTPYIASLYVGESTSTDYISIVETMLSTLKPNN